MIENGSENKLSNIFNSPKNMVKKDDKSIASDLVLEEIITWAVQVPGVKVDRNKFLAENFSSNVEKLESIIDNGPIAAGISREEINAIADKLILARTSQSSLASFVAGIPGGLAMAATIPADILQFFGMALRLAQELSYLYGAEDLWENGQVDNEKVRDQLILYCGVMFGVSGAVSGVRVLSTQIAKTALKKIPQKALTKTFWYPIIKKVCSFVGYTLTKKTIASGVSKAIPIVGGVISGTINFASMLPMAKRLNSTLDDAAFDYSEEEFEKDIETLDNETGEVTEAEKKDFKESFMDGFNKTKEGFNGFVQKIGNNIKANKNDPYEEIKKLKELLDLGVITEEEFNQKKKTLLNL